MYLCRVNHNILHYGLVMENPNLNLIKIVFFSVAILFTACGKDSPEKILAKDKEKIVEYLKDKGLEATEHESGVFYLIEKEGSGGKPTVASYINITYKGYLLNGKVFDGGNESRMYLYNTILGWQVGIPLFKKGSTGKLFIPSGLGYGEYPRSGIPANSVLIFDIELIDYTN